MPLLISSVLLFYLGAAFAYYVVFPVMLSFFVASTPSGVQMMTDMSSYLDFVMILLLAFGLAFEVPVATVLLVWTGFVKLSTLKKNRGFVLLGIFIFAAFVTPPRRRVAECDGDTDVSSVRDRDLDGPEYCSRTK